MALITCPECGNAVSDKAISCIHCGFPISAYLNVEEQPVEDNFAPYIPRRTTSTPKHVQKPVHSRATTRADIQRTKKKKQKKLLPIVCAALLIMLITSGVTSIVNLIKDKSESKVESPKISSISSAKTAKYPWSNVPYYQEFEPLVNLYLNSEVSVETSEFLIDIVKSSTVAASVYSIDSRITYQDIFSSLKRNGCSIDFYSRESGAEYYVLLAVHLPRENIEYKTLTPILGLVEYAVSYETQTCSIFSYASIYDDRAHVTSNDPSLFGDNDSYISCYDLGVATGDFTCGSRAEHVSSNAPSVFDSQAGGYSLFTDDEGFPYAFGSNGFMSKDGSPIKIKDFESDIFMIYHEERYADNLFDTYFSANYGDNSKYSYEYIGTTYNSLYYVDNEFVCQAYTCDVYKLITPKGKEEFYIIPFTITNPVGVYRFDGNEIPTLWDYTSDVEKHKFLELVWTIDEAYSVLFAQEAANETYSDDQNIATNVDSTAYSAVNTNESYYEDYVYLIEVTGVIKPSSYITDGWEIDLYNPVTVEDWNGLQECSVFYFYDYAIGDTPLSSLSGKTVTITGTPENYRDGGKFFLYAPKIISVYE